MTRKKLSKETLEKRIKWKETLKEIMSRITPWKTGDDVVEEINFMLNSMNRLTSGRRLNYSKFQSFKTIRKVKGTELRDYRVPQDDLVASALVYALERLGAWDNVNSEDKLKEKEKLVALLGYELVEIPKLMKDDLINNNKGINNLEEAKNSASQLLYDTSLKILTDVYKSRDIEVKNSIVSDLENIIGKYQNEK